MLSPAAAATPPLSTQSSLAPPAPRKRRTVFVADRLIAPRRLFDADFSEFALHRTPPPPAGAFDVAAPCASPAAETTPTRELYRDALADNLFDGKSRRRSSGLLQLPLLDFSEPSAPPRQSVHSPLRAASLLPGLSLPGGAHSPRTFRQIPSSPMRVLDAPELIDDYYLNLLTWSSANVLSIALGRTVYLWHAGTGTSQALMETTADNFVTSLSFNKTGNQLAIGLNDSTTEIYDVEAMRQVRVLRGHLDRVSSLAWSNQAVLSTGSRDSVILNNDVRLSQPVIATLRGHTQEVCGLRWSSDGLLASGGNDNLLNVWDGHVPLLGRPKFVFNKHTAAVKALAWCPWQSNVLASGGGSVDRTIRFWNVNTGACINCVDTNSQVCALEWSRHYKELISSHGYAENQLIVWKYPSMQKITQLKGHSRRVLHMVLSADGTTVASCSADETLRFWKVFDLQHGPTAGKKTVRRLGLANVDLR